MITGVIDIPNTEDVPKDPRDFDYTSSPFNSSYSLNMSDKWDLRVGNTAETTTYSSLLWLNASLPTTINPALSEGDEADTVSSQTQTYWLSESGTIAETAADDNNANTWEQSYASFTTEYPYYDYQHTGQSLYQDPVLSLTQEKSNLMLSPSYNFSGLQVTPISVTPKAWDSQIEFLQEVGLKLYMFVPAIVAGTLLSISFWILAMIIIRTYGHLRKKLFPSLCTGQDLEMNPSGKHKEVEPSAVPGKVFRSDMVTIMSSGRELRPTKLYKKGFDGKFVSSSSSFHSSPVSLSSGIGASERDTGDTGDTDSRDSGDTEPGECEQTDLQPQNDRGHHHSHRNR